MTMFEITIDSSSRATQKARAAIWRQNFTTHTSKGRNHPWQLHYLDNRPRHV